MLNTPGVTAVNALGVTAAGATYTDSVGSDDGVIDGSGTNGRSLYGAGNPGIEFVFDAAILGQLPTHAGLVWTDLTGSANVFFEAFNSSNLSLGVIPAGLLNDGVSTGGTTEDRFLGWENPLGIFRIHIYQSGSDMEVDHLQYGIASVPEPSSLILVAFGLVGFAAWAWRRKRQAG